MNRGETPEPLIIDDTRSPTRRQNRRSVTTAAAVGCTALVVIVIIVGAIGAGVFISRNNSVDHDDDEPTAGYRPSTSQPLTAGYRPSTSQPPAPGSTSQPSTAPSTSQPPTAPSTSQPPTAPSTSQPVADLAEAVRNNMDEYASPCDNFFQYSCGGWLSNNPLGTADQNDRFLQVRLKNLKSLSSLIEGNVDSSVPAVQLARKFYYSCKNTDAINARGVQPLLDLVRLTGGWDAISVSNCESIL